MHASCISHAFVIPQTRLCVLCFHAVSLDKLTEYAPEMMQSGWSSFAVTTCVLSCFVLLAIEEEQFVMFCFVFLRNEEDQTLV